MARRVLDTELPHVDVVIARYNFPDGTVTRSGRRTRPITAPKILNYYRENEFRSRGNRDPFAFRQRFLADRLNEISQRLGNSEIPFAFSAMEHDRVVKNFQIDKGCVPFLRRRGFAEPRADKDGYITSLRLSNTFFATYNFRNADDVTARASISDIDRDSNEDQNIGDEVALRQQLSQVALRIRQSVDRGGTERLGAYPIRCLPSDIDLLHMLMEKWCEQGGTCALCDRPIPVRSANRLLQVSCDRTESANPAYDRENARLTHLACNLGKNDVSVEEWREYLAVVREQREQTAT